MRKGIAVTVVAVVASAGWALNTPRAEQVFHVYLDKGSKVNHFAPSGWMGDYGDLKINDADASSPGEGKTSATWTYTFKGSQGANWAGAYYQHPPNNWGTSPSGYNLNGFTKLKFLAKGSKGGETINEFKVGGITGEYSDSGAASIGPIVLTKNWKEYTIDLKEAELSQIAGGFCWATARDANPDFAESITFSIDNVRFEK